MVFFPRSGDHCLSIQPCWFCEQMTQGSSSEPSLPFGRALCSGTKLEPAASHPSFINYSVYCCWLCFSVAGGFCSPDGKRGCTRSCLQMKALRGLSLGAFLCTCVLKPGAGGHLKASAPLCSGLYSRTFIREGKQSGWNLLCSSSSFC